MPAAALLALISAAPQFIETGRSIMDMLLHLRATAQQKGEWDDAAEKAFEECLKAAQTQAHWQSRTRTA